MFTSTTIFLLVLLTLPVIFLLWLSETKQQKVRRMYSSGRYSQQKLADKLGVTKYFVRKTLAAAA